MTLTVSYEVECDGADADDEEFCEARISLEDETLDTLIRNLFARGWFLQAVVNDRGRIMRTLYLCPIHRPEGVQR
jgi:hypothetical protein